MTVYAYMRAAHGYPATKRTIISMIVKIKNWIFAISGRKNGLKSLKNVRISIFIEKKNFLPFRAGNGREYYHYIK